MEVILQVVEDRNYLDAQKGESKTIKLYDWSYSHKQNADPSNRGRNSTAGIILTDSAEKQLAKIRETQWISHEECDKLCTLSYILENYTHRGLFVRFLRSVNKIHYLQCFELLQQYQSTPEWSATRLTLANKITKQFFGEENPRSIKFPHDEQYKAITQSLKDETQRMPALVKEHARTVKLDAIKRAEQIKLENAPEAKKGRRGTVVVVTPVDSNDGTTDNEVGPYAPVIQFLESILLQQVEGFKNSGYFDLFKSFENESRRNLVAADFTSLRVLGQGGFGKVHAVARQTTGMLYAQKECDKARIVMKKRMDTVVNEINTLKACNHPFIVGLHAVYSDRVNVYIVLDLLYGGELKYHMKNRSRPHNNTTIRFWIASLVLALEHMHSHGIVHRDLKPANVLLDEEGFVRVSDFGLSVVVNDEKPLTSCCGTPGFIAPEMYLGPSWDKRRKKTSSRKRSSLRQSRGSIFNFFARKSSSGKKTIGQTNNPNANVDTVLTKQTPSTKTGAASEAQSSMRSIRSMKSAPIAQFQIQDEMRQSIDAIASAKDESCMEAQDTDGAINHRGSVVSHGRRSVTDSSVKVSGGQGSLHESTKNIAKVAMQVPGQAIQAGNDDLKALETNTTDSDRNKSQPLETNDNKAAQGAEKSGPRVSVPQVECGNDAVAACGEVKENGNETSNTTSIQKNLSKRRSIKVNPVSLPGEPDNHASKPEEPKRFKYPRYTHYDTAVDWWSLGVIVHQMTCYGRMPFDDPSVKKQSSSSMLRKVIRGDIWWPSDELQDGRRVSQSYRDLVAGLLHHDPAKRLGSCPNGIEKIKNHPFLSVINWQKLEKKLVVPPFQPRKDVVNAEFQSDNWDDHGVSSKDRKKSEAMMDDDIRKQFEDINYTRPETLHKEVLSCRILYSREEELESDKLSVEKLNKNDQKQKSESSVCNIM